MNDVQNGLRRWRRFRGRLVGCVSLFLMFVVECCGSRVALGAAPGESFIAVRNPRALPPRDVRNTESYIHSYVHRSADGGKTWSTLKIGAEDVPGVTEKSWTHASRNVLELQDGTLILGVSAGRVRDRKTGRFCFDFKSDRLVLDEKTPTDKPSGGGFGNTVQLPGGQLVSAYTYRGEDGNVHAEVLRWALPQPANSLTRPPKPGKP